MSRLFLFCIFFFFTDTATTEIYTLSLHDALPILALVGIVVSIAHGGGDDARGRRGHEAFGKLLRLGRDAPEEEIALNRKSTRLNSSHLGISYAVFCLKKKKKQIQKPTLKHTTV